MSRAIGPIAVLPADGMGPFLPGVSETSESTQRLVDEEVRRIVESAHSEVSTLLREHRSNLDSLVAACSSTRRSTRPTRTRPRVSRATGSPRPTRTSRSTPLHADGAPERPLR